MPRNKVLINQSEYKIYDEEIEALCLGLNFITSQTDPKTKETDTRNLTTGVNRWITAININLHFGDSSDANTRKGRRTEHLLNTWEPPTGTWAQAPSIINSLKDIIDTPINNKTNETPQPIIEAINKLQSLTDLHILKADKGRNTVIRETNTYDREAQRQLSDKISASICQIIIRSPENFGKFSTKRING